MNEILEKQAQQWLTLMLSEKVSFTEQQEFMRWIEQSSLHKTTYFRCREELFAKQKQRGYSKQWSFSLAASVVLLVTAIILFLPPKVLEQQYQSYAQQSTYTLPDGSVVELKHNTHLKIAYSQEQRFIKLLSGDAYFRVAKDKNRPFIVQYNDLNITALGTEFYVRTHAQLQIQVTEHSVKVESLNNSVPLIVHEGEGRRRIKQRWKSLSAEQFNSGLSWRDQLLVFSSEPLSVVLKEFELYLDKPIKVINSAVIKKEISGRFQIDSIDLALNMVAEGLDLQVKEMPNGDILLY
ncbi:FecR domain-containing protein [Colwellia sp. D2M02]|uniref:FecR family protein n=1 Tax=Colwellia sp. D2M02 TaxID=2841562 RepID=UPI001C09E9CF|nr:FecR domain-containing protein [Colwellia sp. D2M02]MBU2892032.1 FecR domain-containing protein [Colwellia sp. D2M02]